MEYFNDSGDSFDNIAPNFEFSQEELAAWFNDLKELTKQHGTYRVLWGHVPTVGEERQPGAYEVMLPAEVIGGKAGDSLTIHYSEPYRVNEEDIAGREVVDIRHKEQLNADLTHSQFYTLEHVDDAGYGATINHEYADADGQRVSPNAIQFDENDISDEEVWGILEDVGILERPMTLDDIRQLQAIADYLR